MSERTSFRHARRAGNPTILAAAVTMTTGGGLTFTSAGS